MPDVPTIMHADDGNAPEAPAAPLGGTRAEAIRRLQIGVAGLAAMPMMIGLANIVMDRAKESDATTVPEAAATAAPKPPPAPVSDPLADAGVVPDVPATPAAKPGAASGQPPAGAAPQP
ncbi:MAG: hypothetical protein PHE36_08115 [Novosphingobium sp.]|nr:hypothetical protein [Novosphingobium sp.]